MATKSAKKTAAKSKAPVKKTTNKASSVKNKTASTKKPIKKTPAKPAKKSTKPVIKKTVKPAAKKAVKPAVKKSYKPIAKKAVKPLAKKAVKPVAKKAAKPIAKKAVKPVAKKAVKPVAKKAVKPVAKKAVKPVAKKAVKPVAKKAVKPVAKKADKPVAKKAVKPVAKKAVKPVAKKAVKPVAKKAVKPVAKKADKPVAKKAVKPEIKKATKHERIDTAVHKGHIEHEDVISKPIHSIQESGVKGTIVNVVKPKLSKEERKALKEKLRLKSEAKKKANAKIDYAEVKRLAKIKAANELENYLKANPNRKLLKLDFFIRSSPTILYTFLKSSSCLALWFCDVCSENGNDYSFTWNGDTQYATLVDEHEDEYVRYRWTNSPKEEFLDFSISKSEISFDTILTITEFVDAGDEASQTELWGEQVKMLIKHIGG